MPVTFAEVMASSAIRVKLVTFAHFILITNALLGSYLPASYLFYNAMFIVSLFWALHCKESVDAIHTSLMINTCSLALDLICTIGWYYAHSFANIWSILFSILNLAARPFSLLILHKELIERGGSLSVNAVFPAAADRPPQSYQDIDRTPKQSIPTNMV